MDRKYDAKTLLAKYRDGTADAQERLLVEQFMLVDMEHEPYLPSAGKLESATEAVGKAIAEHADRHPGKHKAIRPLRPWYRRYANRWVAAAAVLAMLAVGWFFFTARVDNQASRLASAGIAPGGNRATLTLADGRTVDLSSEQEGIVIQDGITYLDGSQVMENEALSEGNERPTFNSITTPKGGTYQITLPDGSKVWLNAGSTLSYPSRFSGEAREVILEGEAFFEISSAPVSPAGGGRDGKGVGRGRSPFRVKAVGQIVEVLGTEFNISAYPDEAETKTTLVEGNVRVDGAVGVGANNYSPNKTDAAPVKSSATLSPGQQATTSEAAAISIREVDVTSYTAWRQGLFVFDETPLDEIMRSISRWYDVEVVFRDEALRLEPFVGVIDRFSQVADVLSLLEATGNARFQVAGRTIIVSPNKTTK